MIRRLGDAACHEYQCLLVRASHDSDDAGSRESLTVARSEGGPAWLLLFLGKTSLVKFDGLNLNADCRY